VHYADEDTDDDDTTSSSALLDAEPATSDSDFEPIAIEVKRRPNQATSKKIKIDSGFSSDITPPKLQQAFPDNTSDTSSNIRRSTRNGYLVPQNFRSVKDSKSRVVEIEVSSSNPVVSIASSKGKSRRTESTSSPSTDPIGNEEVSHSRTISATSTTESNGNALQGNDIAFKQGLSSSNSLNLDPDSWNQDGDASDISSVDEVAFEPAESSDTNSEDLPIVPATSRRPTERRPRGSRQARPVDPATANMTGPEKRAYNMEQKVLKSHPELKDVWETLHPHTEVAPLEQPADLKLKLLPYQKDGLAWMIRQELEFGGGLLADEMGMGKTISLVWYHRCLMSFPVVSYNWLQS
jgi:DNA repair protein RAD16